MPVAIDSEELSYLIGLIYDCAIDPGRWPIALEAMRVAFGLFNSSLDMLKLPDGGTMLNYSTNIPDRYARLVVQYAPHIADLWGAARIETHPMSEPLVFSRLVQVPEGGLDNPYWRECLEPQGINDALALTLARDSGALAGMAFGRHCDGPPIDDRMIDLARLLLPHAQRAAAINRLLDIAALRDATFDALFDTLRAPVLVVDAGLNILHANRAGRALIVLDDTLRSRGGTLSAVDRMTHHALIAAINDATGDYRALGLKGVGIPLLRNDNKAGALHVLPLRPDRAGSLRLAAIFVAEAGASPAADDALISALFGLTPGEAAVFEQVAGGRDVRHAAAALGIAQSTVRTHLLRIYDKTGVRRQAELVRLSASLAAP